MTNILRIAKSGVNALTNTSPENLIFSSEYGTLKYFVKVAQEVQIDGSVGDWAGHGTYTHSLGYYPFTEVFVKVGVGAPPTTENYEYCPLFGSGASVAYNASYIIKANTIELYCEFSGVSSSVWYFEFLIFLYKNNLNL